MNTPSATQNTQEMNNLQNHQPATSEKDWGFYNDTERYLREKFAETDRMFKESRDEFDRRMKKLQESIGSWNNNHGSFAEEYFFNSFENGERNFFGEKFDKINKHVPGMLDGFDDGIYEFLSFIGRRMYRQWHRHY
jgi:hypothetical protein